MNSNATATQQMNSQMTRNPDSTIHNAHSKKDSNFDGRLTNEFDYVSDAKRPELDTSLQTIGINKDLNYLDQSGMDFEQNYN